MWGVPDWRLPGLKPALQQGEGREKGRPKGRGWDPQYEQRTPAVSPLAPMRVPEYEAHPSGRLWGVILDRDC